MGHNILVGSRGVGHNMRPDGLCAPPLDAFASIAGQCNEQEYVNKNNFKFFAASIQFRPTGVFLYAPIFWPK